MTTLAPGLVWCRECKNHQALAVHGVCPVCDPSIGKEVSNGAQRELDRIDAALAGADDTSAYDGTQARWSPEGEREGHQTTTVFFDESQEWAPAEPLPSVLFPAGTPIGSVINELVRATRDIAEVTAVPLWSNVGLARDGGFRPRVVLGFDGSRSDDVPIFAGTWGAQIPASGGTHTVTHTFDVSEAVSADLLRLYFGNPDGYVEVAHLEMVQKDFEVLIDRPGAARLRARGASQTIAYEGKVWNVDTVWFDHAQPFKPYLNAACGWKFKITTHQDEERMTFFCNSYTLIRETS